jgi:hypothetical protein
MHPTVRQRLLQCEQVAGRMRGIRTNPHDIVFRPENLQIGGLSQ